MSKHDIELVVTDREGTRIAALPEAEIEDITWELVAPGTANFRIHPLADNAGEILLVEREVQIWIDGEIEHWVVPWGASGAHDQMRFQCDGVLSLFRKRFIDDMSMDYSSIEQMSIAWDLLSYAQSESTQGNRDLNISAGAFTPSGVVRSPRYDRNEHANILYLVTEFSNMANGFEFSIVLSPDGTQRWWTPHFPRKGSLKTEFHMRYEVGKSRNIARFTYNEDATHLTTHAYATGASEGEIKFEQNYEDLPASARFGVMQAVVSEGNQKDIDWLMDRAVREVESNKIPKVTKDITSVTSEDLKLGDIVEGDWLPVTIDYGRIQADDVYRVKSVTWKPDGSITYGFDGETVVV